MYRLQETLRVLGQHVLPQLCFFRFDQRLIQVISDWKTARSGVAQVFLVGTRSQRLAVSESCVRRQTWHHLGIDLLF